MLPRIMGHKKGLDTLEKLVAECVRLGVEHLTVFAFSTENWRRPMEEVNFLMNLFLQSLQNRVKRMHQNQLRLRVIGDRSRLPKEIIRGVAEAEALTQYNQRLTLTIAADYGGRWDMLQAVNQAIAAGESVIDEAIIRKYLCLGDVPEPDLFIRTGGEKRMSNFLLWHLAYTELYFTDTLWPDFDTHALQLAMKSFQSRERRFGRTSEQLPSDQQRE